MKRCTRCDRDLPVGAFAQRRDHSKRRTSHCRECKSQYDRDRYQRHRAKINARNKRWADANRERARELTAAWYRENRPAWVMYAQRRRAHKAGATAPLTDTEWATILASQDGQCFYCGCVAPLEQEHKVPLSRGGEHSATNVVGACGDCNRRKGTRTAGEFMEVHE